MIDTHAHLDFKEFNSDRDEVIKRAFNAGIEKIINVGCNLEKSKSSVELAQKYPNIYGSVGIHPHDVLDADESQFRQLNDLVSARKVVAIGEIGLDYFQHKNNIEKQKEAFLTQLKIAESKNLPVIIHCRDAYNDLLEILRNFKKGQWRGVAHCFLGSWQIAQQFLDLGFLISFTGAITYQKTKPKNILPEGEDSFELPLDSEPEIFRVIKNTPLDKIMLETDCPYLAPVPMRGKRNEPAFIKYIAEKTAEIKGIKVKEVENITSKNAKRLFKISD